MVSIAPDLLVVFGGRSNTNLSDTHLFNLSSLTWHPLECGGKTLPPPRHFHSASAYKNNIYVFGGIAGKIGSLNDLFRLSLGSWVNTAAAISPPSTPTSVPSNILGSPLREDAFSGGDSIGSNKQGSHGSLSSASPALSRASGGGGLSGSATRIRLKCQFADEIRVIPVSKSIELTELKNLISETGGLGTSEVFLIQYKDEEDDLITIRSTEELHEAFDACEEEKQKFFRIFINYSSMSPANSARIAASQNPPHRRDSSGSPPRRRSEDIPLSSASPSSSSSGSFPKGRHSPQASGSPIMGPHHHQQQQQPPAAPPTPKMPIRYKLGTMLGRGAFGTVYLGLDEDTGHLFALKKIQIDPTHNNASAQLDRLQNEIRLLSKVQHPNIVQYLGSSLDKSAQQLLIFLEYVAGGSLMSMMSKFGPFKEAVVRQYCMQVMRGLELLHLRGIVHRDIKSANILVDSNGNIKLSDFGAATSIATLTSHTQIVEAGESQLKSFAGTPYWMAPEVIRQNSYGRKCDVWALGCTLIELTTGKPPWSHLNPVTALFQIANEDEKPPTPPAHLSPQCQDFISRCLTRDADKRPSVHDLTQHSWMVDEINFSDMADSGFGAEDGNSDMSEDGESSSDWSSGNLSLNPTLSSRPPRSVSDGSAPPNLSQLASNSFKNQRK
jgi:serine/threonine protein kinase